MTTDEPYVRHCLKPVGGACPARPAAAVRPAPVDCPDGACGAVAGASATVAVWVPASVHVHGLTCPKSPLRVTIARCPVPPLPAPAARRRTLRRRLKAVRGSPSSLPQ